MTVSTKCLKSKNTRCEKVRVVSLVKKIKSKSTFFSFNLLPNQDCQRCFQRPAFSGMDVTKTHPCDLWGCPAPSRSRLNSCVFWVSEAEREALMTSAFLWHTCSHGREQRALFSTDRLCVCETCPPSITLLAPLPQSIMNMSLFQLSESELWADKNTNTLPGWKLCTRHTQESRHT